MTTLRYCPQCATPLVTRLDEGRARQGCPACGWTHYLQPKVCAAAIVVQDDQVVLIRRTHPPYSGAWGLPAGYVEVDETPDQAAAREVLEETGLAVDIGPLFGVYPFADDPRGPGLLFTYLAKLKEEARSKKEGKEAMSLPPSSFLLPFSSHEGEARWWPVDTLPDDLVGAGQAAALQAWREAATVGGQDVHFCTRCGSPTEIRELHGRPRPQCAVCGLVQFREPKTTAGVLIAEDGKILLARRGVNPGKDLWYLPSGYVDWDERADEAAVRELAEETGLAVKITGLFGVYLFGDARSGCGTMVLYRGRVVGGAPQAGDDVTDVAFFAPDELPPLAFETSQQAIAQWVVEEYNPRRTRRKR